MRNISSVKTERNTSLVPSSNPQNYTKMYKISIGWNFFHKSVYFLMLSSQNLLLYCSQSRMVLSVILQLVADSIFVPKIFAKGTFDLRPLLATNWVLAWEMFFHLRENNRLPDHLFFYRLWMKRPEQPHSFLVFS